VLTTENGFDLTTHNDLIYLLVREAGLPGGRCRAGAGRSCGAFWRPLPGACCRQAGAAARELPGGCGRDRGDRPLLRGGDRRRPVAGRRGRPNPGKSSGARAKERSRWGGRREEKMEGNIFGGGGDEGGHELQVLNKGEGWKWWVPRIFFYF